MAVISNNVLLYYYDIGGEKNVSFHPCLSGYELTYSEDGPFPNYYRIWAREGGSVSDIIIGPGGEMKIDAGASCRDITVLSAVGNVKSPLLEVFGGAENITASSIVRIEEGGILNGVTVLSGGMTNAYNGSLITNGEVCSGGNLTLFLSSMGQNITVSSGGYLGVQSGSTATNVTLANGAALGTLYTSTIDTMYVSRGASCLLGDKTVLKGSIYSEESFTISGTIDASQAEIVFGLQNRIPGNAAIVSDWTKCAFGRTAITVSEGQKNGLYALAGNAGEYDIAAEFSIGNEKIGILTTANALGRGEDVYYIGYTADSSLAFVKDECSYVMLSADESLGNYVIAKSFAKTLSVYMAENVQPIVAARKASEKELNDDVYCYGWQIGEGSQLLQTQQDRVADFILPAASGVWDSSFCAYNTNIGEYRGVAGKNRYDDLVWSSGDAALLMLSDSPDALFADDIFTDVPEDVAQGEARLKGVNEVRAGKGDDIIDFSMEHASDANCNIILRGGEGNDILWGGNDGARLLGDTGNDEVVGGNGNDILAGGAGDDRLTGAGGRNIYAFGTGCGNDVVILSEEEEFRLWFEEGAGVSLTYNEAEDTACVQLTGGIIDVMGLAEGTLEDRILIGKAEGAVYAGCDYDTLKELGAFDGDSAARYFNTLA